MLTIINPETHRQTDYSRDYLAREARRLAKLAPDSDGKLRSWSVAVVENRPGGVSLCACYLRRDGTAAVTSTAL